MLKQMMTDNQPQVHTRISSVLSGPSMPCQGQGSVSSNGGALTSIKVAFGLP